MPSQLKFVFRETFPSYSLEVEFTGSEIDEIMEQYSEAMPRLHETIRQYIPLIRSAKKKLTCIELLLRLIEEFWFDEARRLSETQLKLQQLGFNFDKSTIAHALRNLSKSILYRGGTRRNFHYIRRR